jgi:hypothetical protein
MKFIVAALATVLLSAAAAAAHEGHAHKTMGVVSVVHENHLEVTDVKNQKKTFTLDEKTKIWRGRTALRPADIKVGERVVVTYHQVKDKAGKLNDVVRMVQLGVTPAATKTSSR